MTLPTVTVRRAEPDEWRVIRRLRLRALRDSPHAFGSELSCEVRWLPAQWTGLFERSRWFVASAGGDDVGLLRSVREPGEPGRRHLESVWVEPAFRRRGLARGLVTAAAERERLDGVAQLFIWVLDGNEDARRAYERMGFRWTGERQVLAGTGRLESRFVVAVVGLLGS